MVVKRNPHSIVSIGGLRFDSWTDKQLVKHVEVELATDMSSQATLTVFDPRFRILDSITSGDGVPQVICFFYLGFGQDLGPPVFKGLLARVEYGDGSTTFVAYDMGLKMKQELKTEYHQGINDLQILKKLATRNGLRFEGPDVVPPLEKHPSLIHPGKNDWEHSMERKRAAGFVVFVRQDTLFCKQPAKVGAPILTLRYRKDFEFVPALFGFSLQYKLPENQQGRPRVVHQRGRKRGGKLLVGISSVHSRGHHPVRIHRDMAQHTKLYANTRAHAHKELQREPSFNVRIKSIAPLPGVRPDVRNTIALENVGKLFSGPYLCDKVTHTFTPGNLDTEYNLYRDIAA